MTKKPIEIDGLRLPSNFLTYSTQRQVWEQYNYSIPKNIVTINRPEELSFWDYDTLLRENRALDDYDHKSAYGLLEPDSGTEPDVFRRIPSDKMVFIAGNYDEDFIALSYEYDMLNPIVVATHTSSEDILWGTLFESFDDFQKACML